MKLIFLDLDREGNSFCGDHLASGVTPAVDLRLDHEAAAVRRVRDQIDSPFASNVHDVARLSRPRGLVPSLPYVLIAMPVARAATTTPPQSSACASLPTHSLLQT